MAFDLAASLISLKPNDWTAMAFGFTGFLFALITLIRSLIAEKRARKAGFEQRRLQLIMLVNQTENSIRSRLRRIREIVEDAQDEGFLELSEETSDIGTNGQKLLESVIQMKTVLHGPPSNKKEWAELEPTLKLLEIHLLGIEADKEANEDFLSILKRRLKALRSARDNGLYWEK